MSPPVLADALEIGERGIAEYEKGNLIIGMQLLEQASNGGYAPAQSRYAYILDKAEENDQAFVWFKASAEQENADGQFGLAKMYANGEGVEKNMALARTWFSKAANNENTEAMRVIAIAHEKGNFGFPVEPKTALFWYSRAADQGDTIAIKRLTSLYENGGMGVQSDADKAKFWKGKSNPQKSK